MALVVSSFCALAALAAVQQRTDASAQAQVRTKVLPGNGYIRYQVEPGDDQQPAGELVVLHEERKPAPAPELAAAEEPAPPPRARTRACADERGKLLSRLFEMQGLEVDPDFARWLERNSALGTNGIKNLFLAGGEPLLQLAVKTDGIARTLAEDLARCEALHRGR